MTVLPLYIPQNGHTRCESVEDPHALHLLNFGSMSLIAALRLPPRLVLCLRFGSGVMNRNKLKAISDTFDHHL